MDEMNFASTLQLKPMRPKARGLAQHGGPPGWLEESDPAGVILYEMDGPYRLPFTYTVVPVALTGAAQLRAEGIVQVTKNVRFDIKAMNICNFQSCAY